MLIREVILKEMSRKGQAFILYNNITNMDTLVTIGVLASFIYSIVNLLLIILGNKELVEHLYFESSAMIIYFIKLGRFIDKRSKEYMAPFGFKDHKVVLPMKYKWIVDTEGNPDIELIHNLCMVSSNVYFWYLLTYPQKSKLYWLLMDNPKKKVFGYNDPFFTFGDLIDLLNRYVFVRDSQQDILSLIMYERKDPKKITDEMKIMIDNNIERIMFFENQENYFFKQVTDDIQIENNLRPYRAFIYTFVKDWLQLFDIENNGGLDGRPNIKAVHVFASFAGRQ